MCRLSGGCSSNCNHLVSRDPPRLEHYGADPRLAVRPNQRDEGSLSRPQQQPRGQEPSRAPKDRIGSGPPPPPHRDRGPRKQVQREAPVPAVEYLFRVEPKLQNRPLFVLQEQVWREPSDQRPKSSYTARDGSPQSPRDKRPLSGPNIHTPNLPVTDGGMKTAQQTTRPFNTYPRSDSEGGRSPTGQVGGRGPPIGPKICLKSGLTVTLICLKAVCA